VATLRHLHSVQALCAAQSPRVRRTRGGGQGGGRPAVSGGSNKDANGHIVQNAAASTKLPRRSGITLADFVKEWRVSVAVNLKPSTTRPMESHLRAHLIPKLGDKQLTAITMGEVQTFVAYLARGRSRKMVENVLLTLSSILHTAKAWDYACGDFKSPDLTCRGWG
jgi:hypothetical protein